MCRFWVIVMIVKSKSSRFFGIFGAGFFDPCFWDAPCQNYRSRQKQGSQQSLPFRFASCYANLHLHVYISDFTQPDENFDHLWPPPIATERLGIIIDSNGYIQCRIVISDFHQDNPAWLGHIGTSQTQGPLLTGQPIINREKSHRSSDLIRSFPEFHLQFC